MYPAAFETYDVVIVGSGGAGLRAAVEVAQQGLRAIILTKGDPKWSGGTLSAHYSFCGILDEPAEGDSPEVFAQDIIRSGEGISNPQLVHVLTERSGEAISFVRKLGVRFDPERPGSSKPHLGWLAGHTYPRAVHVGNAVGREVIRVLLREVKRVGIPIHSFTHATDLIVEDGQLKGVLAFHVPSGEIRVYQASAVVMATGGGSQVYELNTNPLELTGDGYAMALRAGAELVDMEFVQFYPTVIVFPPGARGLMFNSGILIPMGARLVNKHGEDFWERYHVGPLKEATRDILSKVIAEEIAKGNGTEHGGVYISTEGMDHTQFPQMQQQLLKDVGLPPEATKREVAPGAHYFMGGIRIDTQGATPLPGLFAAGECAGGIHGANRLAGAALTENQVFGQIAGYHASLYARRHPLPNELSIRPSTLDRLTEPIRRLLRSAGTSKISPIAGWKAVQKVMQTCVGPSRSADGLNKGLAEIEEWRKNFLDQVAPRSANLQYNRDISKALDLRNMLDTAWSVTYAALLRQETRGAHVRLDYPHKDENWEKSLVIRQQGDKLIARSIVHKGLKKDGG